MTDTRVRDAARRLSGLPPPDGNDAAEDNDTVIAGNAALMHDIQLIQSYKLPDNAFCQQALQDSVFSLCQKTCEKHHGNLLQSFRSGDHECGRNALEHIERFIAPKTEKSVDDA